MKIQYISPTITTEECDLPALIQCLADDDRLSPEEIAAAQSITITSAMFDDEREPCITFTLPDGRAFVGSVQKPDGHQSIAKFYHAAAAPTIDGFHNQAVFGDFISDEDQITWMAGAADEDLMKLSFLNPIIIAIADEMGF